MSIRDRQLTRTSNKVLKSELLAGRFPELIAVQTGVNNVMAKRQAGLPRFILQAVAEGDISSSNSYNQMMDEIHEDLDTMFEESGYQTDRLMAIVNYYETEKSLIQMQLRRLENRMDGLLEKLDLRIKSDVIFDTFQDFQNVEFIGFNQRNRSGTDAFIDLLKGEAVLNKISKGDKIDLTKASINITPMVTYVANMPLSKPELMLTETVNETWRHALITNNDAPAVIQIDIAFQEAIDITCLSFESNSPKSTEIIMALSKDGTSYQTYTKQQGGLMQWNFNSISIKSIRLILTKYEADEMTGTNSNYIFGCKSLSIYKEGYQERGLVVSRKYYIGHGAIDKVTLKVNSVLPPSTNIRYYVSIDNDDLLEWQEIEPGIAYSMDGFETIDLSINNLSLNYGDIISTNYDTNYYNLITLPYAPRPGATILYVGENMWQQDIYQYNDVDNTKASSLVRDPSLKNWGKTSGYQTNYVSFDKNLPIKANSEQRFTINFFCEKADIIDHNNIQIIGTDTNSIEIDFNVYLNNNLVKPVGGLYTYYLKAGWNTIQIITSTRSDVLINNVSIDVGFELNEVSKMIFASKNNLREISMYDLLNNTSRLDLTNFAIDDKYHVIINYDPKYKDYESIGVTYRLSYQHAIKEDQNAIRFMAILNRDPDLKDVSPRLRSYQLIVE